MGSNACPAVTVVAVVVVVVAVSCGLKFAIKQGPGSPEVKCRQSAVCDPKVLPGVLLRARRGLTQEF